MVRHCGRPPPARPPAGAVHPRPAARRPAATLPPEPRPAASVQLPGGALLPASPFLLRRFPPGRRRYARAEEAERIRA